MTKTYRGSPGHDVTVEVDGLVLLLEHHVEHSPTGFSWGYGGSGPADLARSILWDHLGAEPTRSLYQEFKFRFVATWPQNEPWELSGGQVDEWLSRVYGAYKPWTREEEVTQWQR